MKTMRTEVPSTPDDRESGTHRAAEPTAVSREKLKELFDMCFEGDPPEYPTSFSHKVMAAVRNDLTIMGYAIGEDEGCTQAIARGLIMAQRRLDAAIEIDRLFFSGEEDAQ
ncbi:MAG TPA: hypothetical protein VK550_34740 [Polyangiaceae bacterium]|nr:hypothetical protein [Polyangiaceae bacterium]